MALQRTTGWLASTYGIIQQHRGGIRQRAPVRAGLAGGLVCACGAGDVSVGAGSSMRGDKRRTIRCQDGVVVDHPTGRRWRLKDYLRGGW